MSWHYLQGREEESWEGSCLDGVPSALSKLIPTADLSCSLDNATESCLDSQSGTMSEHSTDDRGEDTLMLSAEDSPVRISHAQDEEKAFEESDRDYGQRWRELSTKFDPVSYSWRIRRFFGFEVLPWSSRIWPKWGMMRNGAIFQQRTAERPIKGTGFGYLPTPTASEGAGKSSHSRTWSSTYANLHNFVMGKGKQDPMWKKWPTPTANRRSGLQSHGENAILGHLNPAWVEWLMGWPIGWTDLKPLEMGKFQEWLRQHGRY